MKQNSCWSAHQWGHACWSQKWLSILGPETTRNICSPSPLVLNHPPNSPHDQQSYHPPSHALHEHRCLRRWQQSSPFTPNPHWNRPPQSQPLASLCWILAPLSSKLSAVSATLTGMWHQSLSVLLWLTCCKDSTVIRFSVHESSTVSTAISHSHNPSSLPHWATSWACLRSWRWATHHESGAPEAQEADWIIGCLTDAEHSVSALGPTFGNQSLWNIPTIYSHAPSCFLLHWWCGHAHMSRPSLPVTWMKLIQAFCALQTVLYGHFARPATLSCSTLGTPPIYCPYFANPLCHPHLSSPHGFQSLSIFPASWSTETAGSHRSLSPITKQGPVPPIELFAFTTDPSESTNQLMSGAGWIEWDGI